MSVVKKQMYLTEDLDRTVKAIAAERNESESQIIREAIAAYAERIHPPDDPFDRIIGMYTGPAPKDGSINHDRYLYSVPADPDA